MQANGYIDNMHGGDGENNSLGVMEISRIFVTQDDFFRRKGIS